MNCAIIVSRLPEMIITILISSVRVPKLIATAGDEFISLMSLVEATLERRLGEKGMAQVGLGRSKQ